MSERPDDNQYWSAVARNLPGECLAYTDEELAVYAEGRMPRRQANLLKAHLQLCSTCQEIVRDLIRELQPEPVAVRVRPAPVRSWSWGWALGSAAAAAAVLIVLIAGGHFRALQQGTSVPPSRPVPPVVAEAPPGTAPPPAVSPAGSAPASPQVTSRPPIGSRQPRARRPHRGETNEQAPRMSLSQVLAAASRLTNGIPPSGSLAFNGETYRYPEADVDAASLEARGLVNGIDERTMGAFSDPQAIADTYRGLPDLGQAAGAARGGPSQ